MFRVFIITLGYITMQLAFARLKAFNEEICSQLIASIVVAAGNRLDYRLLTAGKANRYDRFDHAIHLDTCMQSCHLGQYTCRRFDKCLHRSVNFLTNRQTTRRICIRDNSADNFMSAKLSKHDFYRKNSSIYSVSVHL
jgi:hypothetical protein